jgi:hypothetical protein
MNKENITKNFIIGTFVTLYLMVSIISTIHVIDFFKLSNPEWLAITLAVAFEVGAAASLASIIALKKMNKGIVWTLFFILTFMQAMGNTYYAYTHLANYQYWVELFGLVDSEVIEQKRILSLVSGAILPLVALGFIKSLVDYIKPDIEVNDAKVMGDDEEISTPEPTPALIKAKENYDEIIKAGQDAQHAKIMEFVNKKRAEREAAGETYEDEPTALANSGIKEKADFVVEDEDEWVDDEVVEESTPVEEPIVEENEPETVIEETPIVEEKNETLNNNFLDKIKVYHEGQVQ